MEDFGFWSEFRLEDSGLRKIFEPGYHSETADRMNCRSKALEQDAALRSKLAKSANMCSCSRYLGSFGASSILRGFGRFQNMVASYWNPHNG